MTCKDCIHYELCLDEAKCKGESLNDFNNEEIEDFCRFAKPKSRYIELPCAVGDTVYIVAEVSRAVIECIVLGAWVCEDNCTIITHDGTIHNASFGKTVFLTKEEAETALKEKQQ